MDAALRADDGRAADASPIGIRATISLAVLTPIAAVSEWIGLDAVAGTVERAVGREPGQTGGAFVPPPEDIPVAPPDDPNLPTSNGDVNGARRGETRAHPRADPDRKLRVAIVGDSLAAGLGFFAERVFRPGLVWVSGQGRISTGLARPDYFNWPDRCARSSTDSTPTW